eukprot:gb/GECG01004094.1/.p1 GENE.gb/GECG01004094.1/~~gb/GECG01004094.1/.p1  ORF type:complete len:132 (+),score=6.14 gb/GECG01004094.1/:1-396(+)
MLGNELIRQTHPRCLAGFKNGGPVLLENTLVDDQPARSNAIAYVRLCGPWFQNNAYILFLAAVGFPLLKKERQKRTFLQGTSPGQSNTIWYNSGTECIFRTFGCLSPATCVSSDKSDTINSDKCSCIGLPS